MRITAGVAVTAGAIAAIAFGGIAMAAELDPVAPVETTAPGAIGDDVESVVDDDPAATSGEGLECVLADDEIECSGTGNERSAEVALVPRYLAHSEELSGAERGAAISEWAKTHANRKDDDEAGEPVVDDGEPSDDDAPSEPSSPGRSGDAPGRSGSQPETGRGR